MNLRDELTKLAGESFRKQKLLWLFVFTVICILLLALAGQGFWLGKEFHGVLPGDHKKNPKAAQLIEDFCGEARSSAAYWPKHVGKPNFVSENPLNSNNSYIYDNFNYPSGEIGEKFQVVLERNESMKRRFDEWYSKARNQLAYGKRICSIGREQGWVNPFTTPQIFDPSLDERLRKELAAIRAMVWLFEVGTLLDGESSCASLIKPGSPTEQESLCKSQACAIAMIDAVGNEGPLSYFYDTMDRAPGKLADCQEYSYKQSVWSAEFAFDGSNKKSNSMLENFFNGVKPRESSLILTCESASCKYYWECNKGHDDCLEAK